VCGELQEVNEAVSTRHWKVAVSLAENSNVGVESLLGPVGPAVIVVSGGVESPGCTVQEELAGVASGLPAASRARTWNWCEPIATVYVAGEEQDANAAPSSEHSKLDPVSVDVNSNCAVVLDVVAGGPAVIVVWGATVSTVMLRPAGLASTFPAESIARTSKVCAPWVSVDVVWGEEQGANDAESTRHWKVDVSLAVNSYVGVVSFVGPLGPAVMVVSGGVVSAACTVQARLADVASVLPAASRACTSNACEPTATV
jgi:hypothetical protein